MTLWDGPETARDEQLQGLIAAVDEAMESAKPRDRLKLTRAEDVQPVPVAWLWERWLPYGKLVVLDGPPGVGKSMAIIDLIARATRGGPMPADSDRFEPITVMIAGVEDGWADTIRPRLDAANADLAKVFFVDAAKPGAEGLTIPKDVMELAQKAREVGARWLHIDAIMGSLSEDVSAYSDKEVRRALGPLKQLAEDLSLIITFIRHPRKSGGSATTAGGGSIAFIAIARVGLFIGMDPTDPTEDSIAKRRVLAVSKGNLAPLPQSLTFTIGEGASGGARINWGSATNVSADDLAGTIADTPKARRQNQANPELTKAEQFLESLLQGGAEMTKREIVNAARAQGLSTRTVDRAATAIGVTKHTHGPKGSRWSLPKAADAPYVIKDWDDEDIDWGVAVGH